MVVAVALICWAPAAWGQMPQPGGMGGMDLEGPPAEAEVEAEPEAMEWDGQRIDGIEVDGTQRVEDLSVRERIDIEEGSTFDREEISATIRRIFELGYFADIQVEARDSEEGGVILRFVVEEMPAIDAIRFEGADEFSDDDLESEIGIRRFSILDINEVNESAEAIRALYEEEGYFLAEVDFEMETREDRPDLAVVVFKIQEYAQVEVKRVNFLGNVAIEDDELQSIMATREGGVLSFLTDMGAFQEQNFEEDLQRITAYYYNEGYVQVQVEMPTLRLTPDKRHLYITIRVDEGPQHYTGEVDISGDMLTEREELLAMTRLGDDRVFSYGRLQEDMMRLQRFYQDAGYANAQVIPRDRIDAENHIVDVTYDINKGEKVRIGRIEVEGNSTTRDRVIRRELAIEEGEWYSASAIETSQRRVERLGYFEEVNITPQQSDSAGAMDLTVQVAERPTGTFQLGAGLSSQESFIFQGQVSQENLLGRGQSLQLSAQLSSIRTLFNLRFTEPWFMGTRWSLATDLYNFDFLYQDFARRSMGGTLTLGYPIGELLGLPMGDDLRGSVRYKLEDVDVRPGGISGTSAQSGSPFFEGGLTSSLRLGMTYDTRDNRLFPTDGAYHSASVEVADGTWTLSGNEFAKFDTDFRGYFPVFWNFVLRLNSNLGYVAQTRADSRVPIFERYYVGGPDSVRGFERFALGPTQRVASSQSDPVGALEEFQMGGNKSLVLNAELEFPIFAAAQLRGVFFADVGNAFDDGQRLTLRPDIMADDDEDYEDALRTAVGFGMRWFSPIGPLRFEWGFPLQRLPGERPVVFDFSIEQAF